MLLERATALALFSLLPGAAQTTQGLIEGRVYDGNTGTAIEGATVSAFNTRIQSHAVATSNREGRYAIPSLSPGIYTVRTTAPGYAARETNLIELPVAGRSQLEFPLRSLEASASKSLYDPHFVPGSSAYVHTYSSDVQNTQIELLNVIAGTPGVLESTLSYVVTPAEVDSLPLPGRDLYSTLALQPGVTSYGGTARGLGLTVAGQRPSSSNFLLDGVENNNHLTTGPLTTVAPEAIQEYRISTHNYSAEYGRTSGAVANAVSRSAIRGWHGLLYSYLAHDRLNANGFQENRRGVDRAPLRQSETGATIGAGLSDHFFISVPFDWLRYRSRDDPIQWLLPTREFIANAGTNTDAGKLLRTYALPIAPSTPGHDFTTLGISPPVTIDRDSGVPRVDYVGGGKGRIHLTGRLALSQLRQPDLFFTPYPDLSAPFRQGAANFALGLITTPKSSIANEFRAAFGGDSIRLDRPHSEVPFSSSGDGVLLPGSPATMTFHNSSRDVEVLDNLSVLSGRNAWKFGGGFLHRKVTNVTSFLDFGQYTFLNLNRFAADEPELLLLTYDRSRSVGDVTKPPFDGRYAYNQFYLFAQSSRKVSRRFFVNYGLRYEYFGEPNLRADSEAYEIQLGPGAGIQQSLANASWGFAGGRLYSSKPGNIALRAGWAYDISGAGTTLIKGSYGWFYDRPFDNLWQGIQVNRLIFGSSSFGNIEPDDHARVPILTPPYQIAKQAPPNSNTYDNIVPPVFYQPEIRAPRAQNFFLSVEQRIPSVGLLEIAYAGSVVSGLTTTDGLNRPFTVPLAPDGSEQRVMNPEGLLNPGLPDHLSYRANQGKSNYHALTATLRFETRRVRGQAAYTWSHSIDLQSDPLAGEFLNFNFFDQQRITDTRFASFTRQFDSQADRASSDFDQRHNFVAYGVADLPAALSSTAVAPLFRSWEASATSAIRSGFPYTVLAKQNFVNGVEYLFNNPANLLDPSKARIDVPAPGGRILLQGEAFGQPAASRMGTSGRNQFHGPGLVSLDVSLARSFRLPLGENTRVTLRCDAYNVLNHANLNNPGNTIVGADGFGVATFGRRESNSGFPLLTPFSERARIVQLMLRIRF